jgi:hypothetical protein
VEWLDCDRLSQPIRVVMVSSPQLVLLRCLMIIHTVTSSLNGEGGQTRIGVLTAMHDRIGLIVTLISA